MKHIYCLNLYKVGMVSFVISLKYGDCCDKKTFSTWVQLLLNDHC